MKILFLGFFFASGITRETKPETPEEPEHQCELVHILSRERGNPAVHHRPGKCAAALLFSGKSKTLFKSKPSFFLLPGASKGQGLWLWPPPCVTTRGHTPTPEDDFILWAMGEDWDTLCGHLEGLYLACYNIKGGQSTFPLTSSRTGWHCVEAAQVRDWITSCAQVN